MQFIDKEKQHLCKRDILPKVKLMQGLPNGWSRDAHEVNMEYNNKGSRIHDGCCRRMHFPLDTKHTEIIGRELYNDKIGRLQQFNRRNRISVDHLSARINTKDVQSVVCPNNHGEWEQGTISVNHNAFLRLLESTSSSEDDMVNY